MEEYENVCEQGTKRARYDVGSSPWDTPGQYAPGRVPRRPEASLREFMK